MGGPNASAAQGEGDSGVVSRLVKWALMAACLGLFAAMVAGADMAGLAQVARNLGWGALLGLVPYFFVYLVDTRAWALAFERLPAVHSFRLFLVRWAGESVNNVLPSAYVAGEVVKVRLLGRLGFSPDSTIPASVISKTAQTVSQIVFIACASLAFIQMNPPDGVRWALWLILGGGLATVALFFWMQRRGFFKTFVDALSLLRIRPAFAQRLAPAIQGVDAATRAYYIRHPWRFAGCVSAYLAGWLMDTVEIYVFALLAGHPISWWQALVIEAFTGVAKALGWFVPASAGVQDSGLLWVARMTGMNDAAAIGYALFRRGRELIYAAIGLCLFAIQDGGFGGLRRPLNPLPGAPA